MPNYRVTLDMQSFMNARESRHNTIDYQENIPTEELRRVSNRQRHLLSTNNKRKKNKSKSKSKSKKRLTNDYVQDITDDKKYKTRSNASGSKYNSKDIRYQDLYSIYRNSNVESSASIKHQKGKKKLYFVKLLLSWNLLIKL
jgi:hypothetical protein